MSAGAVVVLVLAAFAVTVVICIVRGAGGDAEAVPAHGLAAPTGGSDGPEPSSAASDTVLVHVAGAVRSPGVYALPRGARATDAIAAAGGFAPDADRAIVNLARDVSDGEQLLVPVVGAPPPAAPTSAAGDTIVDLNTADAAALDTLPGIGPALAGRILDWRTENGRFASVEDLLAVPGIGEKLVDGLRDRVRV